MIFVEFSAAHPDGERLSEQLVGDGYLDEALGLSPLPEPLIELAAEAVAALGRPGAQVEQPSGAGHAHLADAAPAPHAGARLEHARAQAQVADQLLGAAKAGEVGRQGDEQGGRLGPDARHREQGPVAAGARPARDARGAAAGCGRRRR